MFELRDMALLQLFFSEFADRATLAKLAERQVKLRRERLAVYDEITARYKHRKDRQRRLAPLGMGVLLEKAYIKFWRGIAETPPEA
jgi:hypothetical protein